MDSDRDKIFESFFNCNNDDGLISLDFEDVRNIAHGAHSLHAGFCASNGSLRLEDVAKGALAFSSLTEYVLKNAKNYMIAISTNGNFGIRDAATVEETVKSSVHPEAEVIFGVYTDEDMKNGEIQISIIAAV